MAFKYRQKKTIRRKRRFLYVKRKSAKTYRRSPTKRRSMRGGEEDERWNVNVNYFEYKRDKRIDDEYPQDDLVMIQQRSGQFVLSFNHSENRKHGYLILNGKRTKDSIWNRQKTTKFFLPDRTDGPIYIRSKPGNFYSFPKKGDIEILSFEIIQQNPTKETGMPHFPSSAPETVWPVDVFLQIPGDDRRKEDENEQDYNERVKHLTLDSVPGYVFMFDPAQHQDGIKIEGKLVIKDSDPTHKPNMVFKVIDGNYYPPAFYSFLILDSEGKRRGIVSHFRKTD